MSDRLNHECGLALIRLLKPLEFYQEKYGSASYGLNKLYLMLEKQHNRGQDGAGFASVKFNMKPGQRFMHRERSADQNPIQEIFKLANENLSTFIKENPKSKDDINLLKKNVPHVSELFLGHVRYGTFGKNSKDSVHPFLRQNNWMHRNLIVAGNFNMTNNKQMFQDLVRLGQHPKEMPDTVTVMERIGHFLDDSVSKIYKKLKKEGVSKMVAETMDKWGRIDILVNNAGILRDKSFHKVTIEEFNLVMDVHFQGSFYASHAVYPIMREQNFGRIIFTTSSGGLVGSFGQTNYGAAKMAMIGLMNCLKIKELQK